MGYKIGKRAGLLLFLLLTSHMAAGQAPPAISPPPFIELTLSNGLHVILSEDYSLPLVSVVVAYKTGSIHEEPGKTGLAYLLENLMFQGSENIGRMQHINYIQKTGGALNASTSLQKTVYYQTVPSNQLALVLWLESDRMDSLSLNRQDVNRVKDDLIEEIIQRRLEDSYLESQLLFDQYLFPDFAYHHPLIGEERDIHAITFEDVEEFYSKFYRPNNAVLCIVGNFNRTRAEGLIRDYFENISRGEDIPEIEIPSPQEMTPETLSIENSVAASPATRLGYRIAAPFTDDYYRLMLIEYLLLHGRSSRLIKRIVKRNRYAFDVTGGIDIRGGQSVFKLFVINNNERLRKRTQDALFDEIDRLKNNPVSQEELNKAKNLLKIDYYHNFSTYADRALFFCHNYIERGGLDHLPGELEKYLSATPTSIIGVANRYFNQKRILIDVTIR